MVWRGQLNVTVIGIAKSGWNQDNFRVRAKDSIEKRHGFDARPFEGLSEMLRYVDVDYKNPDTFKTIHWNLGLAQHPASDPTGRLRFDSERKIRMAAALAVRARS